MPKTFDDRNRVFCLFDGVNVTRGDVPEPLRRRYRVESNGGHSVNFYVAGKAGGLAFRDRGRDLVATGVNLAAIRDMMAIARHRGWPSVYATGATDFRREVWLTGTTHLLLVSGFAATAQDREEGGRRIEQQMRRQMGFKGSVLNVLREVTGRVGDDERWVHTVAAVVGTRLFDHESRTRLLDGLGERIAQRRESREDSLPDQSRDSTPRSREHRR